MLGKSSRARLLPATTATFRFMFRDERFLLGDIGQHFDRIVISKIQRHLIRRACLTLAPPSVQAMHQFLDREFERFLFLFQRPLGVLHAGARGQEFLVDLVQTSMRHGQLTQELLTGFQIVRDVQ